MTDIIKKVPLPTAGVALGLASLGILLQPYSEVLHFTAGGLSLLMVLILAAKIIGYTQLVKEDLKNPIFAGAFATLFMTVMQLATYLVPLSFVAAFVIWCTAVFAHFSFIAWFTATFMVKFNIKQVFPTHFIAYVGIVVASLTSPVFGLGVLGMGIFWFGSVCFVALLVMMIYRYVKHEVPESAKPLFCIFAAPMSLSLAAYLMVSPEPLLPVVITLTALAQICLIVVLSQLPKMLRLKFYPSYAAMTFPFVVCAIALAKATAFFAALGASEIVLMVLGVLVVVQTVFAAIMVMYVFARYFSYFFSGVARKQPQASVSQTN